MSTMVHLGSEVVYNETVSNVTSTNSVNVGMRRLDDSGNEYVYAYNAGNSQISQGQFGVICSGASGYSLTVTSVGAASMDLAVGVARNATAATGQYFWAMCRGFSPISTDNVSGATNQVLALGSLGNFQVLTSTAGSFITSPIVGKLAVSVATGVTAANAAFLNFM